MLKSSLKVTTPVPAVRVRLKAPVRPAPKVIAPFADVKLTFAPKTTFVLVNNISPAIVVISLLRVVVVEPSPLKVILPPADILIGASAVSVIESEAHKVTSAPAALIVAAVTVKSVVVSPQVSIPVSVVPPLLDIVIVLGSSNQLPISPLSAEALTLPV